jgi:hypothetical protein
LTKPCVLLLAALGIAAAASAAPERGRDPFVFRAVLDERPRMLVLALRPDFWVAYDAERAALYKVWEGGVHFTGAVYDWLHGPQPTSQGRAFWVSPWEEPWEIALGGRTLPARVRWRGHRLSEAGVTLLLDERTLPVRAVELSPDRRRILLALEGLAEGRVVHLEVLGALADARGQALWSREAWYTLNRLPR